MELTQTMKELLLNVDLNKGTIKSVSLSTLQALTNRGIVTDQWAKALASTTTQGGSFPIYHDIKLTADGLALAMKLQLERGKKAPLTSINIPVQKEIYIKLVEYLSGNSSQLDPSSAIGLAVEYWIKSNEENEGGKDTSNRPKGGYLWRRLYLPQGTVIRTLHKSRYHYAFVVDEMVRHECSEREECLLANQSIAHPWDSLEIKRPTDENWMSARSFLGELIALDPLYTAPDNPHPPCPECFSRNVYELYYGTIDGPILLEERDSGDKYRMFGGDCCVGEPYKCMTCAHSWGC
ncbi:hypothetical protein [Porticoccus sp.]